MKDQLERTWFPDTGQRSVTWTNIFIDDYCSVSAVIQLALTTIEWNGPVYAGEYGSALPVSAKHRPQASPAPEPGAEPNESWFIAAVYPVADLPQAVSSSLSANHSVLFVERAAYQGSHILNT